MLSNYAIDVDFTSADCNHNLDTPMQMAQYLANVARKNSIDPASLQLPECAIIPKNVNVIMISEVPPKNLEDCFYSSHPGSDYVRSTLGLFNEAGVDVKCVQDILDMGIYITTAVKTPKTSYAVETNVIKAHLPILEAELALFPNLKVVMLMGDVAKKTVNIIARKQTKKSVVPPSGSTYKIRGQEFYWGSRRVFPSYIMTGGNILIEKSKREMIADDIRRMIEVISNV